MGIKLLLTGLSECPERCETQGRGGVGAAGADPTGIGSCSSTARRKEPQQHSLGREQGESSAAARQPRPAPHKVGAQSWGRCWGSAPNTSHGGIQTLLALELRKAASRRAQGGRFCPPRLKATLPQARVFPFKKLMAPVPLFRPVLARQLLLTSVPGYCQNAIKPKGDCISCLGL